MGESISPIRNPAYRRSRPTFCIPKAARCGPQIAVFSFAATKNAVYGDRRKGLQGYSRSRADVLFTHDLCGSDRTTTPASSAKRAVEDDFLQGTLQNREFLIVQSRDE
jgi:hypothetical protein